MANKMNFREQIYKKELNSEGKKFYRVEKPREILEYLSKDPWELYEAPFRIAPHVYYVSGNLDFACYLIDTGDGYVIIDTSMFPHFYLLIQSFNELGFDIKKIKKILISHAHCDHHGGARALKELTGAEIYLSKEDWDFKFIDEVKRPQMKCDPYEVDHFYNDDEPIELGNIKIRTRRCPGHTPGVTAFFFDDTDETTGKTYHVAMHGGAGVGGKKGDENNYLRQIFIKDCEELKDLPVDIVLASHGNQTNMLAWVPEDRNDYTPFVDSQVWHDLMVERREAALKITEM